METSLQPEKLHSFLVIALNFFSTFGNWLQVVAVAKRALTFDNKAIGWVSCWETTCLQTIVLWLQLIAITLWQSGKALGITAI